MGQRVTVISKLNFNEGGVAKASFKTSVKLMVVDPKPSDLSMPRVKVR